MKLSQPNRIANLLMAFTALVALLLASGCLPGGSPAEATPNPTLLAVERMLTETSAAPQATETATATLPPTQAPPEATPEPGSLPPVSAAEPVVFGPVEVTVLSLQKIGAIGDRRPSEGLVFVDVEVRVRQVGPNALYTASFFNLVTADGSEYPPLNQPVEPQLRSGTLHEGEFVRGHITFEAPDSEPYLLRYRAGEVDARLALAGLPSSAPAHSGDPAMITQDMPRPGHKVEAAGVALEINQVLYLERLPEVRPASGWVYVSFFASIFSLDRENMPYNPGYFRLKDPRGYEYAPASVLPEESLNPGTLKPGQRADGRLIFEVPAEAVQPGVNFLVSYLPTVLFEEYQYEEIRIAITPRK